MTEILTILCPVTSRNCGSDRRQQPLVHALLPSMDKLEMWGGVRLVVGYDHDDPVWNIPKVRSDIPQPIEWVEVKRHGASLTAIWNVLEKAARPWEWLLPANDDLAFEDSPLPAIPKLESQGMGTVAFHDSAFPELPTFYVVGSLHAEIFGTLYPLPWGGAHQDSWIADVYRPWRKSEIDPSIKVHNRKGPPGRHPTGPRFDYGVTPPEYRDTVMAGRQKVNAYLRSYRHIAAPLPEYVLEGTPLCIK